MIARIALVLLSVAAPALAQLKLDPVTREILQLQIALEREGFSPGIVDGKTGPKLALAVAEFQRRLGLNITATLDPSTRDALSMATRDPLQSYAISAQDIS